MEEFKDSINSCFEKKTANKILTTLISIFMKSNHFQYKKKLARRVASFYICVSLTPGLLALASHTCLCIPLLQYVGLVEVYE